MSDDVLSDDDRARLKPLRDRLAALKNRSNRVGHWAPNKRYVIDFELSNAAIPDVLAGGGFFNNTEFAFREAQALVDRNAVFLCEEIEVIYSIVGTAVSTDMPATLVLSPPWRGLFFDFYLKLRDSGSDREWQNDWIPGSFFQSANLGGLILGDEGHARVSVGSAVFASLQVAQMEEAALVNTGITDITSHQVKVSLIGCQIPLESA